MYKIEIQNLKATLTMDCQFLMQKKEKVNEDSKLSLSFLTALSYLVIIL